MNPIDLIDNRSARKELSARETASLFLERIYARTPSTHAVLTPCPDRRAPILLMPSGAGHDAMVLTRHVPTAVLFIPSIGGPSHDITDDTDEVNIFLGIDVPADPFHTLAERKVNL